MREQLQASDKAGIIAPKKSKNVCEMKCLVCFV